MNSRQQLYVNLAWILGLLSLSTFCIALGGVVTMYELNLPPSTKLPQPITFNVLMFASLCPFALYCAKKAGFLDKK